MKDPFLKPVILGGLTITFLSATFAPGICLWAIIGGYLTTKLAIKISKEVITLTDGLLLGIFTGIIGGTSLDVLTIFSFNSPENKRLLIDALKKNWPKDLQTPNFNDILPVVFLTTCFFIIIISIIFALIGVYAGIFAHNKKKRIND